MKHLTAVLAFLIGIAVSGCTFTDRDGRPYEPGPPHPGAANPYSNGGFHDPGPNYPPTGI
jgi:hypothetical protein